MDKNETLSFSDFIKMLDYQDNALTFQDILTTAKVGIKGAVSSTHISECLFALIKLCVVYEFYHFQHTDGEFNFGIRLTDTNEWKIENIKCRAGDALLPFKFLTEEDARTFLDKNRKLFTSISDMFKNDINIFGHKL